jgi:four helix bundle protein
LTPDELKKRTKKFGLDNIYLIESLPNSKIADVLGKQLMRSATSVGANYRSACRAKSEADFVSKILIGEEEADESMYWLEVIQKLKILPENKIIPLLLEANELVAIFAATVIRARGKNRQP